MWEKWKQQRKKSTEKKKYGKFKPGKYSPFLWKNRVKMMRMIGSYKNFFKIINIRKGKTDRLFMDAKRKFRMRDNKETINRGTLTFKHFTKMFPLRGAVVTLFGLS